ncbi:uncharacterized protein METZ01_LOCUS255712 [marine metagenome]|uniref:Uncharacterized protein n=1 Tax=marine metagenome TaxID=408172 RepID=A0A382ITG3_9ZZZZ
MIGSHVSVIIGLSKHGKRSYNLSSQNTPIGLIQLNILLKICFNSSVY